MKGFRTTFSHVAGATATGARLSFLASFESRADCGGTVGNAKTCSVAIDIDVSPGFLHKTFSRGTETGTGHQKWFSGSGGETSVGHQPPVHWVKAILIRNPIAGHPCLTPVLVANRPRIAPPCSTLVFFVSDDGSIR